MAKLNHNPSDIDEGFAPGTYSFLVKEVELRNDNEEESPRGPFGSGNHGFTLTIECFSESLSFNSWENFVYTPRSKFKLKEMCESIGLDFDDDDLDTKDFVGKRGKVEMTRKDGSKYLEVDQWVPADEASDAKPKKTRKKKPKAEDQVPF